jgi:hypothetical protein
MSIPTGTVHNSSVPTSIQLYLDTVVDKLLYLVHGPSSQQLLRISGWAHVARVQEVQQLLSCSKPVTVLRIQSCWTPYSGIRTELAFF